MLKTEIIHPDILKVLAESGHGSQILITDGNFPAFNKTDIDAKIVNLNFKQDLINSTQALDSLAKMINIEKAELMKPENDKKPDIFKEFKQILSLNSLDEFKYLTRFEFYDQCSNNKDLNLVIVTGETRLYANILLTIGVID